MLIRHPTNGLFLSVNADSEVCLASEGATYLVTSCGVPGFVHHRWDEKTNHLKNTVTGKCLCQKDGKIVESEHMGSNDNFEWTIEDGTIKNYYSNKFIDGDVILVDETETQWHIAESFEDEEEEDDVPVNRGAALIEEALNATVSEALSPAPVVEEPASVPEPAPVVEEPAPVVEEPVTPPPAPETEEVVEA